MSSTGIDIRISVDTYNKIKQYKALIDKAAKYFGSNSGIAATCYADAEILAIEILSHLAHDIPETLPAHLLDTCPVCGEPYAGVVCEACLVEELGGTT